MGKKITDNQLKSLLHNWVGLNDNLRNLLEGDLEKLLEFERNGKNRRTLVQRIFIRLHRVRGQRELAEILETTPKQARQEDSPQKVRQKDTPTPAPDKKQTPAKKPVAKKKAAKKKAAKKKVAKKKVAAKK